MTQKTPSFFYLPWVPRDFQASTRTWPLVARAVYRELLDAQWDVGGTLPEDPEELKVIARATPAEWRIAWKWVEPKFPCVDGGRRNARLEEHRQKAIKKHTAMAMGAAKTNARRWGANGVDHDQ